MRRRLKWLIPVAALVLLAAAFLIYTGDYYHADGAAAAAFSSDGAVRVSRTDYGWFFDGPSDGRALVFYPGGKVEETAYAPLLRLFAENGMDVCLVSMPFRLAVFGMNKAADVMERYDYDRWYVGGHSLGGAMAAAYAAAHPERLDGLILLAAYPTKEIDGGLASVSVYGSEDRVLDLEKVAESRRYFTGPYSEYAIEGGNHAQFGSYGPQAGDGTASIAAEAQRAEAVRAVLGGLSRPAE